MKLLDRPEYQFLKTDPHLGRHIIFLTYGGSYAYGTNVEGSDIDIRGCTLNSKADLLGMGDFEQVVDTGTDTAIYAFNKLFTLLISCNPNTIELLGCKPEHYQVLRPIGKQLIAQRKMFLSRRAADSFGGYANQQLRRLENALAHDAYPAEVKERHIMGSCENTISTFPERYCSFTPEQIKLSVAQVDGEPQVVANIRMEQVPLRTLTGMVSELVEITRNYDKIHHRNKKKDDAHLNKHAMHLVRLYLMCLDILEKEEIVTCREADHNLLMDIRNGRYQKEDHSFNSAFYDLLNDLERRLDYAKEHTSLPEMPDLARIEAFKMEVNERVVRDEF
ncbi:nucleotidyltransferase domain-containing protein [Colidextribacter sp. OB.20]|uniref:DNA polymerase beta superfamily protein n=1 Tax=Colidextribacter sp. OB.20 TaxID=2304568 RepID=UPI001FAD11F0|nr:nucleotidyltransferase domain-containing protein [Colidextribacter sp. OB.20]